MKSFKKTPILFLILLTFFLYNTFVFNVNATEVKINLKKKYNSTKYNDCKAGKKTYKCGDSTSNTYRYSRVYIHDGNYYWCLDSTSGNNSKYTNCNSEIDTGNDLGKMFSIVINADVTEELKKYKNNGEKDDDFFKRMVYPAKSLALRAVNCGNLSCNIGYNYDFSNVIYEALYHDEANVNIDAPEGIADYAIYLIKLAKNCKKDNFAGSECSLSGGSNKSDVNFGAPTVVINEKDSTEELQSRYMFINIKLKDFDEIGKFTITNASMKYSNSTITFIGASSKFSKNIEDYKENVMTTDAFQLFSSFVIKSGNSKKLSFYVAFKIDTKMDLNNIPICKNNAIIEYKYSHLGGGKIYYCEGSTNTQSFVGSSIETAGGETIVPDKKTTPTIVVCDPTCDPAFDIPLVCKDGVNYDDDGNISGTFKEGYDKQGKLNIKRCIINNTDKKGNTYENRSIGLNNNPYCSVFCKEDLNVKLPYKRQTYNGRYFDIPIYLEGTQSCYTDKINYEKFEINFAACAGNKKCELDHVNLYNQCASWTANYNFAPNLSYNYGESCNTNSNKKFISLDNTLGGAYNNYVSLDGVKEGATTTIFCFDEVANNYSCNNNNFSNNNQTMYYKGYQITRARYIQATQTKSGKFDTRRVYYTNNSTGQVEIHASSPNDVMYVDGLPVAYDTPQGEYFYKITLDKIGTFYGTNNSSTGRIYGGTVKSLSNGKTETAPTDMCNPGQKHQSTINNFYGCTYTVNDDKIICKYEGRDIPISDCDSLNLPGVNPLDGYSPEEIAMCKEELCPFCVDSNNVTHTLKECVKPEHKKPDGTVDRKKCRLDLCPCPDCDITCVGPCCSGACVDPRATYDSPLNLRIDYRLITPSSVIPNQDSVGANWDVESENPIISEKASRTISEIEGRANKYEGEQDLQADKDKLAKMKDYKFKIILTPGLTQELKTYNHKDAKGDYGNKTLECYDYDLSENISKIEAEMGKKFADKIRELSTNKKACKAAGYVWLYDKKDKKYKCVMDNIFCYSKVIDELYENKGYAENFDAEIMKIRKESKTTARYNMSVVKGTYNDAIMENEYFTIYTASTFDITGDGMPDAGPAWK